MPRPYVLLSVAQSIDGYIDDTTPERLVLSSPEDLDRVDEARAGVDAILIGATTLRRDNPTLRVKSPERVAAREARGESPQLLRVIVSRSGSLPRDLRLWGSPGPKVVYVQEPAAAVAAKALDGLADVVPVDPGAGFGPVLDDLAERGIGRIMVEGGEQVHTQFLQQDLADELHVTISGFFVADTSAPRFTAPGARLPQDSGRRMRLADISRAGETAVLRYLVER
jgi:5-amino-6-(5-phosphoribosylamino)uracil reductase